VLVKWIRCGAVDRVDFDRGQRAWADLRGIPGFLGQRGGWSRREGEPDVAHIVALWADQNSHDAFMAGPHDAMAAAGEGTYGDIDVRIFRRQRDIGTALASLDGSGVLRMAHCRVRPGRIEHFTRVQDTVWNSGMRRAPGFSGGVFARRAPSDFLVVTQWASAAAHARYQADHFPGLRDRADPAADLDAITSQLVDLVPRWPVA